MTAPITAVSRIVADFWGCDFLDGAESDSLPELRPEGQQTNPRIVCAFIGDAYAAQDQGLVLVVLV